jgi:hypothetical protein
VFFLETRGEDIGPVEERHHSFERARSTVLAAIPSKWRRIELDRSELDRFVFEPDDLVVALGQDGLVANVAKYLTHEQPLIGINPDRQRFEGVLVRHAPEGAADLIADAAGQRAVIEARTMVECRLDDGQRVVAVNEVFLGHASHQSARYDLRVGTHEERQSSSGIVVGTGTGQTGWCRSIRNERGSTLYTPSPTEPVLTLFVREAWPSVESAAELTEALIETEPAIVTSLMETGGRVFGDGIETDYVDLPWGARASIGLAAQRLHLVI